MRFEHISEYYTVLFPVRDAQIDFIESASSPENRVFADIACGGGQQTAALSLRGNSVWGLDLEPSMIEYAKKRNPDIAGRFISGDMQKADELLLPLMPEQPGTVYCIGNSIVQLTDDKDILASLKAFHRLLAPGGVLILQIVNFDRVLNNEDYSFPLIKRELPENKGEVTLTREYLLSEAEGCLSFHTTLSGPYGTEDKTHELRALRKEEFHNLLNDAGFPESVFSGNYDYSPWSPESPATIVKGRKK